MSETDDLTVVMYTCNEIPLAFASKTYNQLLKAAQGDPIIVVSQKPMPIDEQNIVVDLPRHHLSIYRQALIGAKAAETKYIALAEDDVLYSPGHFRCRPQNTMKFAYNMNFWNITTWSEPMFTQKLGGRRNLGQLICDRELFIIAMEERFAKYPEGSDVNLSNWAEPSKYENHLGVSVQGWEAFTTNPPNIMFSHETALSFGGLGTRKRLGEIRANDIPYWGEANKIRGFYQ
jgi:hypothetical protein